MIVPIILLVAFVVSLIFSIIDFNRFFVFGIICLFVFAFGTVTSVTIPFQENPEINEYVDLRVEYTFILNQDSTPFKIKSDLYDECSLFNQKLKDNKKYDNDIWIGMYYPTVEHDLMPEFDLSKIK